MSAHVEPTQVTKYVNKFNYVKCFWNIKVNKTITKVSIMNSTARLLMHQATVLNNKIIFIVVCKYTIILMNCQNDYYVLLQVVLHFDLSTAHCDRFTFTMDGI